MVSASNFESTQTNSQKHNERKVGKTRDDSCSLCRIQIKEII